jgi:catechol 2,3-dioxygenase-like lactoylglutathione lyase family enzyme
VIDHLSLRVKDIAAAKAFYTAALKPLGYEVVMEFPGAIGLGAGGKPDFWLTRAKKAAPAHVAFAAPSRRAVSAFHRAALKAGGTDNGKPGLRKEYHPLYYGAFVLDAEGNNIEAVIHTKD